MDVWEEGLDEPQENPVFDHRVIDMKLPIRRATLTDIHNAEERIKEYLNNQKGNIDYNDVANLQIHLGVINRFEFQEERDVLDTEIHVARLER